MRNPLGRLPALELDDGSCVVESLAIIEYLEELHPEPTMIGRNPRERARVRELERICDIGVLISIGRIVHATRSPLGLPPSPEIAENAQEALKRPLQLLDDCLADGRTFVVYSCGASWLPTYKLGMLELVVRIPLAIETARSLERFSLFALAPIASLILVVVFVWPTLWQRLTGSIEEKPTVP